MFPPVTNGKETFLLLKVCGEWCGGWGWKLGNQNMGWF